MSVALIVLIVTILAGLLYLASLDGSYIVRRSLEIPAGRKQVFDKIRDLGSWADWSPWLMHQPDTTLLFSDKPDAQGGWYSWDGSIVGAGKLAHVRFTGEQNIEQQIEFLRPFKSICRVWWELETRDDNTTLVHWNMSGAMPFLFRFMAKKMPGFIGKDFDTGLYMLRAELVEGAEVPRMTFEGRVELPAQTILTIPFDGQLEEMKTAMAEGYPRLGQYLDEKQIAATGAPFSVYHRVDIKTMHFVCDMAFPVAEGTQSDDFEVKTSPGGAYYKMTLQGSYEFLELAWYQLYSHLQMIKLKPQHKRASIEMYENDPNAVKHSNEIITTLYVPVK